jgi:hypothetical protein
VIVGRSGWTQRAVHETSDPLHDAAGAMCSADHRKVLMRLEAEEGRCFACGAAGVVLRGMGTPEEVACPGCVVELVLSGMTSAGEIADGNWRN